MAAGIPAGQERNFAFENWPKYDVAGFRMMKTAARGEAVPTLIAGSDASGLAVASATQNATLADVEVHIAERRFEDLTLEGDPGLLIANPPYGKRVRADLGETWRALGELYARARAWNRVVLSPNKRLLDAFQEGLGGQKPSDRLEFQHGGLSVLAARWKPA